LAFFFVLKENYIKFFLERYDKTLKHKVNILQYCEMWRCFRCCHYTLQQGRRQKISREANGKKNENNKSTEK